MIEGTLRCVPISSIWFVFAHKLLPLKQAEFMMCKCSPNLCIFLYMLSIIKSILLKEAKAHAQWSHILASIIIPKIYLNDLI